MNLLMISGDRSMLQGKQGAFWYTLQEFHKHWDRIDVICPRIERTAGSGQRVADVFFGNVHFHPSPWPLWRQPRWIAQKGKELVALHRHSVMTVHEFPPFYNGIGARSLSKATGVPYALEIHHVVGYPQPASFTERIGRILSRAYLGIDARPAAAVRTVSKSVAAQLIAWGIPREKVAVVPSFYLDRPMLSSGDGSAPRYDAVFCARLVANKGLQEVIRAMEKIDGATLLVIGDGPERAKAEALARTLKIAHRIEFRGWLPSQEDVVAALKSAKIFVMSSRSEGGPRVALEAMVCGLPVISTKVGVMPDVLEDGRNGLFTTGEASDIAEKIKKLLSDEPLRLQLGNAAKEVLDRFERERLVGGYARFLKDIANRA